MFPQSPYLIPVLGYPEVQLLLDSATHISVSSEPVVSTVEPCNSPSYSSISLNWPSIGLIMRAKSPCRTNYPACHLAGLFKWCLSLYGRKILYLLWSLARSSPYPMNIITVTLSKNPTAQQATFVRDRKQKQRTEPRNKQLCKCDAKYATANNFAALSSIELMVRYVWLQESRRSPEGLILSMP